MAESADIHPTAGRRRREKGPPSELALPRLERVSDTEGEHSDDSAGEKEAKRQRSEPSTPVSTPRRLPYEYDALMGITKVGTKEAEGFDEDLDSTEYHDGRDLLLGRDMWQVLPSAVCYTGVLRDFCSPVVTFAWT